MKTNDVMLLADIYANTASDLRHAVDTQHNGIVQTCLLERQAARFALETAVQMMYEDKSTQAKEQP